MRLNFSRKEKPRTIYVQKSFRTKEGKSTTKIVETLGTDEEICKKYGCADAVEWATAYVEELNRKEKEAKRKKRIPTEFETTERINEEEEAKFIGGDLMLIPLYNKLGLPQICETIRKGSRVKYNLNEILEALVVLRVLCPCSKKSSFELGKKRIRKTTFALEDMYRALSLLSKHIDEIQAAVWENSKKVMERNTRVIYYDCTNYYFEIEDNDLKEPDADLPGRRVGIRRYGKSKEHRPNPIVQMGLLMDGDGIPLSFIIFPGNESEQPSLQKIEEMVIEKYGVNEFIVSTDAGLGSESNRRFNMMEGRDYITVQSLPSLPAADQNMALDPRGWHVAFRDKDLGPVNPDDPDADTFNLCDIDLNKERHTKFYKEIVVYRYENGKKSSERKERVIVTYSHDFALYLKHKRDERVKSAEKIVREKALKTRQTQQDPRKYVEAVYCTSDGEVADHIYMSVNKKVIEAESRFDGFYAFGTSLEDNAIDVLRTRSFHYEIEHIFRSTKTLLEARPIFLAREDRIRSHFLVCFLAMTIVKMLQKQINMPEISIDTLIQTLRDFEYDFIEGCGYKPLMKRNKLTNRLQDVCGIICDYKIITPRGMNSLYSSLK